MAFRRFVWSDNDLCEERDGAGAVTKRFLSQGMKVETGPVTGAYHYTRDHLGSVREVTDAGGIVRARYAYDPYGRRSRLTGDLDADFGFAGMFWCSEAALAVTRYRAYDPDLGRWLSRDQLSNAEVEEGPNLYAYVRGNPVNWVDPLGLCCEKEQMELLSTVEQYAKCVTERITVVNPICNLAYRMSEGEAGQDLNEKDKATIKSTCARAADSYGKKCAVDGEFYTSPQSVERATYRLEYCMEKGCTTPKKCPSPMPWPRPSGPPADAGWLGRSFFQIQQMR
jgi:RHS repeat-associated protein